MSTNKQSYAAVVASSPSDNNASSSTHQGEAPPPCKIPFSPPLTIQTEVQQITNPNLPLLNPSVYPNINTYNSNSSLQTIHRKLGAHLRTIRSRGRGRIAALSCHSFGDSESGCSLGEFLSCLGLRLWVCVQAFVLCVVCALVQTKCQRWVIVS